MLPECQNANENLLFNTLCCHKTLCVYCLIKNKLCPFERCDYKLKKYYIKKNRFVVGLMKQEDLRSNVHLEGFENDEKFGEILQSFGCTEQGDKDINCIAIVADNTTSQTCTQAQFVDFHSYFKKPNSFYSYYDQNESENLDEVDENKNNLDRGDSETDEKEHLTESTKRKARKRNLSERRSSEVSEDINLTESRSFEPKPKRQKIKLDNDSFFTVVPRRDLPF